MNCIIYLNMEKENTNRQDKSLGRERVLTAQAIIESYWPAKMRNDSYRGCYRGCGWDNWSNWSNWPHLR